MANYPNSVPSFATRNAGDVIQPSHVNTLGDEVTAIGNGLLNGITHTITLSSGQIVFPAAQNASSGANTLDDYEEGTWTPTVGGSGGQSGQVYASQVGTYIKIGQLVIASFNVTLSTLGTITTDVQVKGLPFTVNGTSNYTPTTGAIYWSGMTSSFVTLVGFAAASSTAITIAGATAAATGLANLVQANLSNSSAFAGQLIYRAAA